LKKIVTILLCIISLHGYAASDTVPAHPVDIHLSDSVAAPQVLWTPDPYKAVWLAAIVPGLGQIYNRSYWKLPIVYGGFMGCGYAISINQGWYAEYKEAYRDILNDAGHLSTDPKKSYNALIPEGYTLERLGGEEGWRNTLNSRQQTYHRYRDISIVATVVFFALTIIDAYVDAQLFDFDMSEDLSLNIEPQLYWNPQNSERVAEMKLAITF